MKKLFLKIFSIIFSIMISLFVIILMVFWLFFKPEYKIEIFNNSGIAISKIEFEVAGRQYNLENFENNEKRVIDLIVDKDSQADFYIFSGENEILHEESFGYFTQGSDSYYLVAIDKDYTLSVRHRCRIKL